MNCALHLVRGVRLVLHTVFSMRVVTVFVVGHCSDDYFENITEIIQDSPFRSNDYFKSHLFGNGLCHLSPSVDIMQDFLVPLQESDFHSDDYFESHLFGNGLGCYRSSLSVLLHRI